MTAEDWARYGIGEPDDEGWYPDYRPVPPELLPDAPDMSTSEAADTKPPEVDTSIIGIVTNWRLVVADLMDHGIDLWDPAVRARPWPGIRTLIFSLLEPGSDSRLRRALTRR